MTVGDICAHGEPTACPRCDLEDLIAAWLAGGLDPVTLLVDELRRLDCEVVVRVAPDQQRRPRAR